MKLTPEAMARKINEYAETTRAPFSAKVYDTGGRRPTIRILFSASSADFTGAEFSVPQADAWLLGYQFGRTSH